MGMYYQALYIDMTLWECIIRFHILIWWECIIYFVILAGDDDELSFDPGEMITDIEKVSR